MLLLEKTNYRVVAPGLLVKREEISSVVEAQQIIEAAKQEAEVIRREAKEEYERQRAKGHAEGLEKGRAEIAEQMMAQMTQSARYFSEVENTLIDVTMRAVRRVIGEFDDRERVERVVRRALESTRRRGNVTVRVPPAQADWLQSRLSSILESFPKLDFLEVLPDNRLPEDGCVLETEVGIVNATLEMQLKAIERALISAMK